MDNKEVANSVPNPIRDYIKNNLKLKCGRGSNDYYICLVLEGEVISKVRFEGC
jgi:hypothetical protein